MTLTAGLGEIDWSRPWLARWRERGVALAHCAQAHGVVAALNASRGDDDTMPHFVDHAELPPGEAYEAFVARTARVPTRDNLHDFFNGLMWLTCPAVKRRLNQLQVEQLAVNAPGAARGAVRDALTLFDENAALLHAPAAVVQALQARDWHALFVTQRAAWADAELTLFGHALIEKLTRPRKAITAHVWLLDQPLGDTTRLVKTLTPQHLATKPFVPLPVLGVPGWWPANGDSAFYDDPGVFRSAKRNSGPRAAV